MFEVAKTPGWRNFALPCLFILSLLMLCSAGEVAARHSSPPPSGPKKDQIKFETKFLKKQIDSHQYCLTVATWIDARATDPELKTFLAGFVAREQGEMTALQSWLQTWYNIAYIPQTKLIDPREVKGLIAAQTETAFSLQALKTVKNRIANEISEMEQLNKKENRKRIFHAELKAFAEGIVASHRAEIGMIEAWIRRLDPPRPNREQTEFETKFLKKQIDKHQRGITLAAWIDEHTSHTELNVFLAGFMAREQDELTTMQLWLRTWYNVDYMPPVKPLDEDDLEDLIDVLSDDEFDLQALGAIKGYDSNEIAQMKQVNKKDYRKKIFHAELKTFAAEIVEINEMEIGLIKDWMRLLEQDDDDDDDDDDRDDDRD